MTDNEFCCFLSEYVSRQINNIFPIYRDSKDVKFEAVVDAVVKTNNCISKVKAYEGDRFDYMNSGHYATFLYYLSYSLGKIYGDTVEATRVFLLNKAINGIDLYYEIEMPDVFLIGHTVGMVFAKATYSNFCVFHQGCTVGRNQQERPVLEAGIIMFPNSSVIGKCHIRENTVLTPGVRLINADSPGDVIVLTGHDGRPVFKEITEYYADRYFTRK
jgi:serine O-acetyltransferase